MNSECKTIHELNKDNETHIHLLQWLCITRLYFTIRSHRRIKNELYE